MKEEEVAREKRRAVKRHVIGIVALAVAVAISEPIKAEGTDDIKNTVDLTIAIGLAPLFLEPILSTSYSSDQDIGDLLPKLSKSKTFGEGLAGIIREKDVRTESILAVLPSQAKRSIGGITVELTDTFSKVFSIRPKKGSAALPQIEFRSGEIGIYKGKTKIGEGTEARIDGRVYSFHEGKWHGLNKK
jgi:hypothetical protein